jgi:hypothetical protein
MAGPQTFSTPQRPTRFGRAAAQGAALAVAAHAAGITTASVRAPYPTTAEQKAEKAQHDAAKAEEKVWVRGPYAKTAEQKAEKAQREAGSNAGTQRARPRLNLADYMAKLKKEGWK